MKLVSSAATLDFLGKSAPRPWLKRMVLWMIYTGEIKPFFTAGRIVAKAMLGAILLPEKEIDLSGPMDARDAAIQKIFNADMSAKLVGRRIYDYIEDDPIEWDGTDEPQAVGAGFFFYATYIDWDCGNLSAELVDPNLGDLQDYLFWDADDHLASGFPKPDFAVHLKGMCFDWDEIEMLQPGEQMHGEKESRITLSKSSVGRPRKWDWDGALTHLLGIAQHPDGLPTGPGAQAQIEKLIAEWFIASTGSSPTTSQVRACAQRVMQGLNRSET
jgi:hypothetical protein